MINIQESDKKECCGCEACRQVCPQSCITMQKDVEGFSYPCVDAKKCVNCNKCVQVCPVIDSHSRNVRGGGIKAYGGWHKDENVRFDSSSGAAFSLMANAVIEKGGIVYGCTLNDGMKAVHIGVDRKEELWKLRGSKYIQSEIGNVYHDIKQALEYDRKVIFVGTPCQVAGLDTYLGGKCYDNLYKVDFICHGVPSPKVFEAYIKQMEKEYGSKVISFRFRNKDRGWNSTGIQLGSEIKFANGVRVRKYPAFRDSYMVGFLDDIYLRPCCYSCSFKRMPKRYADFTIADFWGVNKISKKLNDGKGTSLVLVCNEHADTFWNQIKKDFYFEQVNFDRAIDRNKSLTRSADESSRRKKFFEDFEQRGYSYVAKKYLSAYNWFIHKVIKVGRSFIKKG